MGQDDLHGTTIVGGATNEAIRLPVKGHSEVVANKSPANNTNKL